MLLRDSAAGVDIDSLLILQGSAGEVIGDSISLLHDSAGEADRDDDNSWHDEGDILSASNSARASSKTEYSSRDFSYSDC